MFGLGKDPVRKKIRELEEAKKRNEKELRALQKDHFQKDGDTPEMTGAQIKAQIKVFVISAIVALATLFFVWKQFL